MSFTIKLCHSISPAEKIGKQLDAGTELTGATLKDNTSILKPIIRVRSSAAAITSYNYMYISEFNRYYFIDDIVSINNGLWEISAHVDVLQTYRQEILNQEAVIRRQQNRYNLYLNDPDFQTYNYDQLQTLYFSNTGFLKTLSYVLVVNGS